MREMKVYNGKVYGVAVLDYGLEKGYLDYQTLAGIVGDKVYISITVSDEEAAAFNEWVTKEFLYIKESC